MNDIYIYITHTKRQNMNEDGRTNVVKCQQSINLCEGS